MRGQTRYLLHCVKRITLASAGKENSTELMFAPHPREMAKSRAHFCFTGGAEHRTSDSLSPGEREKSRALFVLREDQNTTRAIPSLQGIGRKAEHILFYGKSRTPHKRFPLPWERVRVRASNRTHYPSTIVLNRQVQQRRPCSSKITISQLWFCRPRCSG